MDEDLSVIPTKALKADTRNRLAKYLNHEELLVSENNVTCDYRGLAECMKFDYHTIKSFCRLENPTVEILKLWEKQTSGEATIGQLLEFLKKMGRNDACQAILPMIRRDVEEFDVENTTDHKQALFTKPHKVVDLLPEEDVNALACDDTENKEHEMYDAYVCHAEEDLEFVYYLADFLESRGLKLFIPARDLLSGHLEVAACIKLINDRCNRMLAILSPDFTNPKKNPSCVFLANCALGIAIEQVRRMIIPVVIKKPCDIPDGLKYLTKIDFTGKKKVVEEWVFPKLMLSIQNKNLPLLSKNETDSSCRGTNLLQIEDKTPNQPASNRPPINCQPTVYQLPTSSHPAVVSPPTMNSLCSSKKSLAVASTEESKFICEGNSDLTTYRDFFAVASASRTTSGCNSVSSQDASSTYLVNPHRKPQSRKNWLRPIKDITSSLQKLFSS